MKRYLREVALGAFVGAVPRETARAWLRPFGKMALNETDLLVSIAEEALEPGLMVDVGARYGTSLTPCARKGWNVIPFEPDPNHMGVLRQVQKRLPNITLDARAVSEAPSDDAVLFVSGGSSSGSSLLAFEQGHSPGHRVSVITLQQALTDAGQLT